MMAVGHVRPMSLSSHCRVTLLCGTQLCVLRLSTSVIVWLGIVCCVSLISFPSS